MIRLKNEIHSLQAIKDFAQIRCTNAEKQVAEISASELKKLEDARTHTRNEMSALVAQLKEDLKSANANCETAKKSLHEVKKEHADKILEAEKTKNAAVRDEVEKVREELSKKNDSLLKQFQSFTGRLAGSSTKGKDNEVAFAALLDKSFGVNKLYERQDKIGHKSGDHIIEWEGMKIMIENKKYAARIPPDQVNKAMRDFESKLDCNVLMFVSEDSSIAGHERPGHLDITHTDNGRTAIWIGHFSSNEDKVVYLQMVAGFIRELGVLQKSVKQLEGGEAINSYKVKVEDLLCYFNKTKLDLERLLKLQKDCQREQNKTWDKLKEEMVSVIARFASRQADINGERDTNSTTNGANVDATMPGDTATKAKKPRLNPPTPHQNEVATFFKKIKNNSQSLEQSQSVKRASDNTSEAATSCVHID